MTDSTRRSLRTAYQTVIGALAAIGALVAFIPTLQATFPEVAAIAVTVAAGAAAVSKVINALEDKGLIPAWLKTPAQPSDDVFDPEAEVDGGQD